MKVSSNYVTKSRVSLALMMAGLMGVASLSHADPGIRDPSINSRQHNQHQRVRQGVRSGELTRSETGALAREQRDIRQLERAYKSDGKLTRAERVDLQREQNQQSRSIRDAKHNEQTR